MIEISVWMDLFLHKLTDTFGSRVWFVGLQGSYGRGEATESSDIDVVVILEELTSADIRTYQTMLDTLPNREQICGFFSGRQELLNWDPSDLFQFYHDTTPVQGSLDELLSVIDEEAVNRAIRLGLCNLYHGCVHNMLHARSEEHLKGLYKAASFVIQALCFRKTGRYIRCQKDLFSAVAPEEQRILSIFSDIKYGGTIQFQELSETLLLWVQHWLNHAN